MANTPVDFVRLSTRVLNNWLFIVLLLTASTGAKKSSGGGGYGRYSHSSQGGSHSYPSSTGLSGTHTVGHSYTQSGLSGNGHPTGAQTYPQPGNTVQSGGVHTYPQPGNTVQFGGGHSYPQSTGISGNNNFQKQQVTYQKNVVHGQKTEVHHHYHYSPPQRVSYGSVSYPVYHSQPPVYVYQYRDSGSRFDNLLTGLALYNLGRMSASHHPHYNEHRNYVGTPGEICKLGILRSNGDYEETRVDCRLMSSFIWDSEIQSNQQGLSKNTVSTSVVNVTQVHTESGANNSITTITVTNSTVVDALEAKGTSIQVTPTMTCYMIRVSPDTSFFKKEIKCGVLQSYAQNSFRRNSAERILSFYCFVFMCQALCLGYFKFVV